MKEDLERLQDTAERYEKRYGNCAQAVVGAFLDTYGIPSEDVFRSSCGLYGGVGLSGDSCGALNGSILVISYVSGREFDEYEQGTPEDCTEMCKEIVSRFKEEYGSMDCRDIQEEIIGESFDFWNQNDVRAFSRSKGPDKECPKVVKRAARWTAEILKENGYL